MKIRFHTPEGLALAGELTITGGAGRKVAGIVLCQGLSGVKEKVMPEIASDFGSAGFACLAFDYRGFGESEGARPRLFPLERADDIRHAVTFLAARPEVDPERIGLYGLSYGGTVVPWAAAFDPRVKAAVAVSGSGNGERWMRLLRTDREWREFRKLLEADRIETAWTGKSRPVPLTEIVPFSDKFWRKYRGLSSDRESSSLPAGGPAALPEFPLSTAAAMADFAPDLVAGLISPRPLLMIHGEDDDVCPVELARDLFRRAGEPKKLVIIPGRDHIDLDHGEGLREQVAIAREWFRDRL